MLPDFAMLLVGANMGVQLMTKEHISIACALQIPIVVVLTKVDIAPQVTHRAHTSSFRPL
jgi:GTPase